MIHNKLLASALLMVGLAAPAQAGGFFPFTIESNFRVNFGSGAGGPGVPGCPPGGCAPWYAYFPGAGNDGRPDLLGRSPSPYPNWPAEFPPADAQAYRMTPRPVQPAAYYPTYRR